MKPRTLDAALSGDVLLYHIEKHVKQLSRLKLTITSSITDFVEAMPFRRPSMAMFKRWDISKMFHQFDEWGTWSRGNGKSFQLGFVRQNLSSFFDTSKLQALVPIFWSQICDCVVFTVAWISLLINGERHNSKNISISGCMRVCFYLWKFSCFLSHCCRCTGRLAFWVLWRLACSSQSTVARAQQPIVTSHCLHV